MFTPYIGGILGVIKVVGIGNVILVIDIGYKLA